MYNVRKQPFYYENVIVYFFIDTLFFYILAQRVNSNYLHLLKSLLYTPSPADFIIKNVKKNVQKKEGDEGCEYEDCSINIGQKYTKTKSE